MRPCGRVAPEAGLLAAMQTRGVRGIKAPKCDPEGAAHFALPPLPSARDVTCFAQKLPRRRLFGIMLDRIYTI